MSLLITATGPTSLRTYVFPDVNATILTTNTAVTAAQGGTGITSYAVGDMLYASAAGVLSALAAVSAGKYLRSAGVTTAPVWSTLVLPNTATQGDLIVATAANTVGSVADVATGSVLVSGGVGSLPAWSASPTLTSVTVSSFLGGPGTLPATGAVRLANFSPIVARTTGGLDRNLLILDASNNVEIGDTGTMVLPGVGGALDLGSASVTWRSGYFGTSLAVGTNAATAGGFRGANSTAGAFYQRNAANSADIRAIVVASDNSVLIGDGIATAVEIETTLLRFSGSAATFPALKRDTIFLSHRLADDSGVTGAATASLPAAAAARDGIIGFDTTLNALVYYVGGSRFKLVGTSF